ncbi:hypothetical protein EB18_00851 [Enterococcus cecorum]|uniref:Uncharacterized protein n=1 Tax=Enterococcus cecorum TaxID=44008 RepID=A0A366SGT5_9ENTE|nr:hypothetical protein EB18_00851 [Enterococcus cecorum]
MDAFDFLVQMGLMGQPLFCKRPIMKYIENDDGRAFFSV